MSNYQFTRPLAAFSMSDYENLANFGRGKDKKKRKSRKGVMIAGGVGAGIVGAGAIGAGVRYGGAESARSKARERATGLGENIQKSKKNLTEAKQAINKYANIPGSVNRANAERRAADALDVYQGDLKKLKDNLKNMDNGGAKGQWQRDKDAIKKGWSRLTTGLGNTNLGAGKYKTKRTIGSFLSEAKYKGKRVIDSIGGGYRTGAGISSYDSKIRGGIGDQIKRRSQGAAGAVRGAWSAGKTGKAAVIGAGLAGAGALAGGGYAAYKALKKRKNRD